MPFSSPFYTEPKSPTKYVSRSSANGAGHLNPYAPAGLDTSTTDRQTALKPTATQRLSEPIATMADHFFDDQHKIWREQRKFISPFLILTSHLMHNAEARIQEVLVHPVIPEVRPRRNTESRPMVSPNPVPCPTGHVHPPTGSLSPCFHDASPWLGGQSQDLASKRIRTRSKRFCLVQ